MAAQIATGVIEGLLAAAAATPDLEICGLLTGQGMAIERAIPAANVSDDPEDSFEIDPAALIAAYRTQRAGGARILGCYHSHPCGPASPSPRDTAAAEPGHLWLIMAGGRARLWRMAANGFTEIAIHAMARNDGAAPARRRMTAR